MAAYQSPTKQRSTIKKKVTFVHNQYNSPLGLYSAEEVAETLQRHTRLLSNGAVGVDFGLLSAPHLNKSEVYKMLSEEESQLHRNVHHQQVVATSEMKRVAWPPTATTTSNVFSNVTETTEVHEYGNDSREIAMPILVQRDTHNPIQQQQQDPYNFHQSAGQQQYYQQQQERQLISQKVESKRQHEPNNHQLGYQQEQSNQEEEELIPPKVPPRVYPKPLARATSDAKEQLIVSQSGNNFQAENGHHSDNILNSSKAAQQNQEPRRFVRMSSRGMPEPFSSNELVGDRPLIAKPSPPPGLILGRSHRKQAPFLKETPSVRSEPFFKRVTPVRMLGDMVWPPKGAPGTERPTLPTQSPGTIRRQQKNYREFFSQNQLPATFPTYRAPPGTQHFGLEEGENATPM